MKLNRVVITGLGMLTPLGLTTAETWEACKSGKSGLAGITRFDVSAFSSQIAGEVKNFDPEKFIDKKELKKLDYFSQYSMAAAHEAINDAKLEESDYAKERIGCVLGVGIGGLPVLEKYYSAYVEGGPRKISPFLIPAMIPNLAPGNIGIAYGYKGVSFTITSACTSSTHAIGESYRMIKYGMQDAMVTGGTESTVSAMGIGGFCAMKALSTRNDEPQKASRPFDKDRDGFVLSEGSVVLVLESLERAQARGAKIYAEILGYGISSDAYHITSPCTDGAGAAACMQAALADANLKPEDICYVNAHGTSTFAGDIAETQAVKAVFKEHATSGKLPMISTKSMTGHLLGAAGAIEAGFSALSLIDGIIPPTINLDQADPACDLDYVPHVARKVAVQKVMSNSFGFGGTNASVILGKM